MKIAVIRRYLFVITSWEKSSSRPLFENLKTYVKKIKYEIIAKIKKIAFWNNKMSDLRLINQKNSDEILEIEKKKYKLLNVWLLFCLLSKAKYVFSKLIFPVLIIESFFEIESIQLVRKMKEAHPYETPAYEVYEILSS